MLTAKARRAGTLAACIEARKTGSLINIWGSVSELTVSHVRIAGISKFTKLGDWIAIETEFGRSDRRNHSHR